jgi:toxin ParE1/3/4
MKYKISRKAGSDIENIWLYTSEKWSPEQADRYFNLIMDEIDYLTEEPKSGINYSSMRKGYFRTRVKSHFIFYKVNLEKEEIEIIRILHQRMDIEARLNE